MPRWLRVVAATAVACLAGTLVMADELKVGDKAPALTVEDWVKVPYNTAYYGSNPREDEGGARANLVPGGPPAFRDTASADGTTTTLSVLAAPFAGLALAGQVLRFGDLDADDTGRVDRVRLALFGTTDLGLEAARQLAVPAGFRHGWAFNVSLRSLN